MAGIDVLIIALTIILAIGIYVLQPVKEHRVPLGAFFSRIASSTKAFFKKPAVASARSSVLTGANLGATAYAAKTIGGGGEGSPDEEGVPDGPLGNMSMEQTMIISSSSAASSAMSFSMMMMMMMMGAE
jgi:hypothetical protein